MRVRDAIERKPHEIHGRSALSGRAPVFIDQLDEWIAARFAA
jgi:hypothetical protein